MLITIWKCIDITIFVILNTLHFNKFKLNKIVGLSAVIMGAFGKLVEFFPQIKLSSHWSSQ